MPLNLDDYEFDETELYDEAEAEDDLPADKDNKLIESLPGDGELEPSPIMKGHMRRKPPFLVNFWPFIYTSPLPIRNQPGIDTSQRWANDCFVELLTSKPELGLPWGWDRLIPLSVATLARMEQKQVLNIKPVSRFLDILGLPNQTKYYERFYDGLRRIFYTNILFGRVVDWHPKKGEKVERRWADEYRIFNAMTSWSDIREVEVMRIGDHIWEALNDHPIPQHQDLILSLRGNPGALDIAMWLAWRAAGIESSEHANIPLFTRPRQGETPPRPGLDVQFIGIECKTRDQRRRFYREFRRRLEAVEKVWPKKWPVKWEDHRQSFRLYRCQLVAPADAPKPKPEVSNLPDLDDDF